MNFDSAENIDVNFFKIQEDFTYENYVNIDDKYGVETESIATVCRTFAVFQNKMC